jgi:hypothetical protein
MKRTVANVLLVVSFGIPIVRAGETRLPLSDYNRAATLTNFPALVVFDKDTAGFSYADVLSPAGYDLRFSNSTETVELDYEIESWDTSGRSYVWVKVPEFTSNTVIHAYWGNPGAAEQPVCCTNGAVWSSSYCAVWHLAPGLKDATSNRVDALANSTAADAEGPAGHGCETGTNKQINVRSSTAINVTSNFTYAFWARTDFADSKQMYIYRWNYGGFNYDIICGYVTNAIEFFQSNGVVGTDPRPSSKIAMPDSGWHHYAYTYDGTTFSKYCDGVSVGSTDITFSLQTGTPSSVILGNSGAHNEFFGKLDEFRIANQARSADWIYAAYLNQGRAMRRSLALSFSEYDRAEPLTNFPALVVLNERIPGFSYNLFRSTNGYDLRFSNPTGTASLNYEIENWNPSGNSYVWVQVPEFTSNCVIHASWGNALDTGRLACTTNGATWADNFRGVWHCNPVKTDTSPYGAITTYALTNDYLRGPAGYYALRSGTSAAELLVTDTNQMTVTTNFTYSFWAKTVSTNKHYITFGKPSGGDQLAIIYGYVAPRTMEFYSFNGSTGSDPRPSSQLSTPDGDWHHYAYSYNGSTWSGYRDGTQVFSVSRTFVLKPLTGGTEKFKIGGAGSDGSMFNGGLDEFRVEDKGRSADWIYACYRNQQARRNGLDYLNVPTFGKQGTVSGVGQTSATVKATLSCRLPCSGTLCYGSVDRGENADAWEHTANLGTLTSAYAAASLTGLQPDRNYVYRFYAESGSGSAWSDPFTFHTAPDLKQCLYKIPFVFSGYTAAETLTNFPALIVLGKRLSGFSYSQFTSEDGNDLRFIDADGVPLDYEIETWNTSGDSYVWVRIPKFARNTTIWAYWRNKAPFDVPVYTTNGAVWDDAFCGVYHLSPALKDSTWNTNHVANSSTTNDAGSVSQARGFSGGANLAPRISGSLSVSEAFTFSLWAKTSSTNQMYLYGRDPGTGFQQHAIIFDVALGKIRFHTEGYWGTFATTYSSIAVPDDGWHQYVYSYDGNYWSAYRDGVQMNSQACLLSLPLTDELYANRCKFGVSQGAGSSPFIGSLDEFRVETAGRSANWILANYQTQFSPETFYTSGSVRSKGLLIQLF